MLTRLENYFGFAVHETTWRTEIIAGLTTFVTMAYIIFVNPGDSVADRDAIGCRHGL